MKLTLGTRVRTLAGQEGGIVRHKPHLWCGLPVWLVKVEGERFPNYHCQSHLVLADHG